MKYLFKRICDRIAGYFGYERKQAIFLGDHEVVYLRLSKQIDTDIFEFSKAPREFNLEMIRRDMALELTRSLIPDIVWSEWRNEETMLYYISATLLRVKPYETHKE